MPMMPTLCTWASRRLKMAKKATKRILKMKNVAKAALATSKIREMQRISWNLLRKFIFDYF
jgi:hypothetical protein